MSADTIARLKITLDRVKPAVTRRVEVPFNIRLDRLHLTIQAAMGWTNSHLYEIRAGDVSWSARRIARVNVVRFLGAPNKQSGVVSRL
jgi:hypothetical protein